MEEFAITESYSILMLTVFIGFTLFIFSYIYISAKKLRSIPTVNSEENKNQFTAVDNSSKLMKKEKIKKKEIKSSFSHKWLISTLRAHSSDVLAIDFSPNGKYMATCSEDRSIFIWYVKDFLKKDNKHVRVNVEFDHATKVKFSPDNKALLTSLAIGETLRIFRIGKKDDHTIGKITPTFDFPHKQSSEIINIGVACNGSFVMSCHKETTIKIWTVKGELLHTIDTLQVNTTHACVSPCGRFVASSGFTSDVKVWEVCFDKSSNFKEVVKAFQLSGHSSGVNTFAFNSDSTRMASVSKDGTWKLWNTDIDYQRRQDPKLLRTWNVGTNVPSLLAFSSDGFVVAIATAINISIYDTEVDEVKEIMHDVHNGEIRALEFSPDGAYLVSTGDRTVKIFHNVVGLRASVRDWTSKLAAATTKAMKERIESQIAQYQELLKNILER